MIFRGFAGFLCLAIALWPSPQSPTFSADVRVVNLFAVVHDGSGRIRNDLAKDKFKLQVDDGPQAIAYFSRQTDLPLTLGLLVDTSASMLRVFDEERTASIKFLKQVLRERSDQAFLVHFDRGVQLLQGLTSSRRKLQAGLGALDSQTWFARQMERPRVPSTGRRGVSTALYDAVVQSANTYMRSLQGRKAIVLLSDGVDDGSASSLNEAIGAALRADTLIYSIHIFNRAPMGPEDQRQRQKIAFGKQVLLRMSRQTGGGFFEVTDKESVQAIFAEIEAELRNQYSLGFTPSDEGASSGFHRVVLTTTPEGFTVQTREGYFVSTLTTGGGNLPPR